VDRRGSRRDGTWSASLPTGLPARQSSRCSSSTVRTSPTRSSRSWPNQRSSVSSASVTAGPKWTFGPERAAAITCPVLSVLGSHSSPLFVEGRPLLHAWFPACQNADIPGATHLLQMQAPGPVAAAIAAFL
jgi:pimeloyl-ACP methyl ester carboxylesterase